MTSREMGEGDLPNSRCFVHSKIFLYLVMLKTFSSVVNTFYDETGVLLLHGFENSFTVNKQKTLTRCVYLE